MNMIVSKPDNLAQYGDERSVVTGMVGKGFYNRNSAPQMAAIDPVMPWLEAAIAEMPLAEGPPSLGVADFGCSEGRNSIAAMHSLVAALRARGDRPIQTVHSDLPTNDYAGLFAQLRPRGKSVFDAAETYSAVVGGSMYDKLLPPRSLHVATSFNAIGYLSRRPLERLPHHITAHGPSLPESSGKVSSEDLAAFAAQSEADLARFLTARAAELVPGGLLLIQCWGSDGVRYSCDRTHDAFNDAMLSAVKTGIIERAGYEFYYQPVYLRTLDEMTGLVANADAPLAELYRLERKESFDVPVPFIEAFRRNGDRAAFARDYTNFFRAFTEGNLRSAFTERRRVDRLVGHVFDHVESAIRSDPEKYLFRYISNAALLSRTDGS